MFLPDEYERAIGPAYAAQIALYSYAINLKNDEHSRKRAMNLCIYLGDSEIDIDFLMVDMADYDNGLFILNILENMTPDEIYTTYTNIYDRVNHATAIDSLRYQKSSIKYIDAMKYEHQLNMKYDNKK